MKLLVVDLKDPNWTHYHEPKTFGGWTLGRRLSNYIFFLVGEDNKASQIFLPSSDVIEIKNFINKLFK